MSSASLWESYQILQGGRPKLVRVGAWVLGRQSISETGLRLITIPGANVLPKRYLSQGSMSFGQLIAPERDVAQRRSDLTGLHLRCTVLPDTTTLVTRHHDGSLGLGGVFGNLFNLIQEIANFTSTCHIPIDRKYGSFENGKWTGMVADLVEDRADIAVALLDVTKERARDIDYLVSTGFSRYMVVMKRPSYSDFQWKTYIQEFHGHVWLLLLLSVVAMMLVIHVITAILPAEEKISLSESFTLVSGCIVAQGSWLNFRTVGARIAFLTAMLSGVLLMAHYTSYLVSALAAGHSLPQYITLKKVDQLGIPTGWTDGTAMSEYIRLSSDDTHRKLWKTIEQNKRRSLVKDPTEGLRRVLQETYLFIETESVLLRYKRDCQYHVIPLLGFNQLSSFTVRKDSPLVPIFNKIIVDIQASGLLSRWWRDLRTKTAPACQSLEGSSIGLPTVFSIFAVMCIGLCLSFLIMLVERFKKRENNVTKVIKISLY
ncbi:glutamate receptor ionotropic, kainate 2 [Penaeus vannamei]|uniref:glutamate receptor ionotropic, kainate 2 n=1 Tax=Penaeus vannamei TaxID=6689 RepID=UPI00387F707C